MNAKLIKSVSDKNFEIALMQAHSGEYIVITIADEKEMHSEPMRDLNNAQYVFDSKLRALQGH